MPGRATAVANGEELARAVAQLRDARHDALPVASYTIPIHVAGEGDVPCSARRSARPLAWASSPAPPWTTKIPGRRVGRVSSHTRTPVRCVLSSL